MSFENEMIDVRDKIEKKLKELNEKGLSDKEVREEYREFLKEMVQKIERAFGRIM